MCISLGDNYNGEIKVYPKCLIKLNLSKNFKYYFTELPDTIRKIELYPEYIYWDEINLKYPNIEFITAN